MLATDPGMHSHAQGVFDDSCFSVGKNTLSRDGDSLIGVVVVVCDVGHVVSVSHDVCCDFEDARRINCEYIIKKAER